MVLIVPAALMDDANSIAVSLGYDVAPGKTYSVPLSGDGQQPATHYGCHTWTDGAFAGMLSAALELGALPPIDWGDLDEARVLAVCDALTVSVRDDMDQHFSDVIATAGLSIVRVTIIPAE